MELGGTEASDVETPDRRMETSESKCVATVFMTSKHFDENGMCHNNDDARILSFPLKLHGCMAKSARPCMKRLETNSQKRDAYVISRDTFEDL